MISKNVPHAYRQDGVRRFILFRIFSFNGTEGIQKTVANVDIFSEDGYSWFSMTHVELKFVRKFFEYAFSQRESVMFLEVEDPQYERFPNVPNDEWIQKVCDRGYALETIREGLGLNLTYLTRIIEEESSVAHEPVLDKQGN